MIYGSVCSGIEAATLAWHKLGWLPVWFAEIEPFPSAVLAHHYPLTPNLGDMTRIAERIRSGEVCAPDVLVGGTPCQAFSVAGLRAGLSDARGQLTLSYVELADEIDRTRIAAGQSECIVVWENVPGVLSSKDNAFGCFLGALAGEECELQPPGGKWKDVGYVSGPKRTIAWRVLDAQYFGLAQRRRRVFVVASARDGFDPAAILFEFDCVRRDLAPSRETGESVAGTLASRVDGGGFPGTDEACSGYVQPIINHAAHCFKVRCGCEGGGKGYLGQDEMAFTLATSHDQDVFVPPMQVRRLTPIECERLQGFVDSYTNVPYRNKPAADGPRYKALGNSMAVPCMRWIGTRIDAAVRGEL